jgi:hypothetical protein
MNKDLDHLKLLGILHTIWGILAILFGLLFGIMYIGIGAAAAASPNATTDDSGMSSGTFGSIFIVLGIVFLIAAVICWILMLMAGGKLRKQRGYGFCFFVAIVDLLGFPSIILGIFTLIVLNRPTVKELFKGGAIPPGAAAQTAWGNEREWTSLNTNEHRAMTRRNRRADAPAYGRDQEGYRQFRLAPESIFVGVHWRSLVFTDVR